ncbi:MAG: ComF family protein [bacterium]
MFLSIDRRKVGAYLLHVLFPRTCCHCRRDIHYLENRPLCRACGGGLEIMPEIHCRICGLPLPHGGAHCFDCRGTGARARRCRPIRAAFVFNPQLRSVLHSYKYAARPELAVHLGEFLCRAWDRYEEIHEHRFLVPVPLAPKRERERGFNQSGLLAEILAREKGLAFLEGVLERARETGSQTRLSKTRRRENVEEAFRVLLPERAKGKKILLVDDVCTTGATLEACAAELKKAGAISVAALVLAREP